MKWLQILGIVLIGLIFIKLTYIFSQKWSDVKIVVIAAISYLSFISLVFLKDKNKIIEQLVGWFWNTFFASPRRVVALNIFLLSIILILLWSGIGTKPTDAYVIVYGSNKANLIKNQDMVLQNLQDSNLHVKINTGSRGTAFIYVPQNSSWQKIYKKYIFPIETVNKEGYEFSVDANNYSQEGVALEPTGDSIYRSVISFNKVSENAFVAELNRTEDFTSSINFSDYILGGVSNVRALTEKHGFLLSYNRMLNIPNYVAYKTRKCADFSSKRSGQYMGDTVLHSVSPSAYINSGYDRGRLLAEGDVACFGDEAKKDTYLTSCIAPRARAMNLRVWAHLLDYCRSLPYDSLFIIRGTIFDNTDGSGNILYPVIGSEMVAIPSHLYMIIVRKTGPDIQSLSFIVPNDNLSDQSIATYLTSIDEIEKKARLQFFTGLAATHPLFKSTKPTALW